MEQHNDIVACKRPLQVAEPKPGGKINEMLPVGSLLELWGGIMVLIGGCKLFKLRGRSARRSIQVRSSAVMLRIQNTRLLVWRMMFANCCDSRCASVPVVGRASTPRSCFESLHKKQNNNK